MRKAQVGVAWRYNIDVLVSGGVGSLERSSQLAALLLSMALLGCSADEPAVDAGQADADAGQPASADGSSDATDAAALAPLAPGATIAAGAWMSCWLSDKKTVVCQGDADPSQPQDVAHVAFQASEDIIDLSVADLVFGTYPVTNTACAVTADGQLHCWEGHGSPYVVSGLSRVARISLGSIYGCALLEDRSVWCSPPPSMPDAFGLIGFKQVTGLGPVRSLSVGYLSACAVVEDGDVYCWGDDVETPAQPDAGDLDAAAYVDQTHVIVPVRAANLPKARAVVLERYQMRGDAFVACALHEEDTGATCWGVADDRLMSHMEGNDLGPLIARDVQQIAFSNDVNTFLHVTAFALDTAGTVRCAGFGNDNCPSASFPSVVEIVAGTGMTTVRQRDGGVVSKTQFFPFLPFLPFLPF